MPVKITNRQGKELRFDYWKFPAGELGVKLKEDPVAGLDYIVSCTGLVSSDDVIATLHACDALKNAGVKKRNVELFMPYLPYARQDRVCHKGESFSLQVFCKILSCGWFSSLVTYDLHSAVSANLLLQEGIEVLNIQKETLFKNTYADVIVVPDKGAVEKSNRFRGALNNSNCKLVYLTKTRTEGSLASEIDYSEEDVKKDGVFVLVDDICDGGATFIESARIIREKFTPKELHLIVSNGIFSKGLDQLLASFDTIQTANLMRDDLQSPRLKVKPFYFN